jgi:hypothetical protein
MAVVNDIPPQGTSPGFDFFEVYQRNTPFDQELPNPTRRTYFNGRASSNLFASDAIPGAPPPVSAFEFLNLSYTDFATPVFASGPVTRLYAAPEPITLALLGHGLGLAGLAFSRRKQ